MIDERFYSECYPAEYYTEIIDKEKKLNLTFTEAVDLLNELNQEAKDEGYYHADLVIHSIKKIYPELKEDDYVYFYKFDRINNAGTKTRINDFLKEKGVKLE